MIDTVILGEDGFLGPYYRILAPDNTHHMWWDPYLPDIKLNGTFWISDMENAEQHHDVFKGNTKPRKLNKNELIERLHSSGVIEKGRKADIVRK